jgi:hypothetical protein
LYHPVETAAVFHWQNPEAAAFWFSFIFLSIAGMDTFHARKKMIAYIIKHTVIDLLGDIV